MRLGALVLTAPETAQACRGAQFPGARLLRASDAQRLLKIALRIGTYALG